MKSERNGFSTYRKERLKDQTQASLKWEKERHDKQLRR